MRILFIILLLFGNLTLSNSQHWEEISSIGGYFNEESGNIANDKNGYIYVTGVFKGEAFFGSDTVLSLGVKDIFLAKYNSLNDLIWLRQIRGPDINNLLYSKIIGFDNANNVYLSGYFYDEISFDSTTFKSWGGTDIFIAKYSSSGDLIWAEHEGSSQYEGVISGSVDNSGNIIIAGFFYDFTYIGNKLLFGSGSRDIFIARFNNMGHFNWAKAEGGSTADYITDMTTGSDNSIYISGYFSSSIKFKDTTLYSNGGIDVFLAKYNSFGNLKWAANKGDIHNEYSESISVDHNHNIYMCGYFNDMIIFDTITLYSNGYEDIFITKFDQNGNAIWAKQAGSSQPDKGLNIKVDQFNNSYITGYFNDDISFGDITFSHQGGRDAFVAILDKNGKFLTAKQMAGPAQDYVTGISIDNSGRVFLAGEFNSAYINFDTASLNNTSNYDIFLAELSTSSYISCIADYSYLYDSVNTRFEFTDLSEGEILKWHWNFGDGDTSDLQNPYHAFPDYGTYTVCLAITAINPFSNIFCTDTVCKIVDYGKPNAYNLGGQVFAGTYPLDAGIAFLYRALSNNYILPADTFHFDTLGYFYFYQIYEGTYIVKVDPEHFSSSYKEYIPAYYGDQPHWENAILISLEQNIYGADIDLLKAQQLNNGPGRINGNIRFVKEKKSINEMPAADIEVLLMDANNNILTITYSDHFGNFSFNDIALGTYILYAEITGMTTTPVTILLDENNPVSPFISLIITNTEIIIGMKEPNNNSISFSENVFPNPASDIAFVEIYLNKPENLRIKIYNNIGQVVKLYNERLVKGINLLPIKLYDLPNGMYIIKITADNGSLFAGKIIKSKAY